MKTEEIAEAARKEFRAMLQPLAKHLGLDEKKDDVFSEVMKRIPAAAPVVKTEEVTLSKSEERILKAIGDVREDLKKDRERVDNIDKAVGLLGGTLAKTLALITGVTVEDDMDLAQVVGAIEKKPASPKAAARVVSIKKSDETAAAEAGGKGAEEYKGHPLGDNAPGVKMIAAL